MKRAIIISIAILTIQILAFASDAQTQMLFASRDKILDSLLTDPASLTLLDKAKVVYSKILIVESAKSTSEINVANEIVSGNIDGFYKLLGDQSLTVLPDNFDFVFNVLPITKNYETIFDYLSQGDYPDALKIFDKMKYVYKIPNLYSFLPKENVVSLWNLLAQNVDAHPNVFDINAAKFIAAISSPYDIKNIYAKTYVWLSGLSVPQAQMGFNVINFETELASVSSVQMDPNLLQWKFTISNYLALYSSITDAIRTMSSSKNIEPFIDNAIIFYKSIQNFPAQYSLSLNNLMSTYLDLIFQDASMDPTIISTQIAETMRTLASNFESDPNASKLLAIALTATKNQDKPAVPSQIWILYAIITVAGIGVMITFPSVRILIYRILGMKKSELKIYMRALSKHPQDPALHVKMATLYEAMGKYNEAQKEYSLAMKLTGKLK